MQVKIHMLSQANPIIKDNVFNTYTKDGMYCVMLDRENVEKYPLINIFRVLEIN